MYKDTAEDVKRFIETELESTVATLLLNGINGGVLNLVPDPHYKMVWGVLLGGWAVAVLYLADADAEVDEEWVHDELSD